MAREEQTFVKKIRGARVESRSSRICFRRFGFRPFYRDSCGFGWPSSTEITASGCKLIREMTKDLLWALRWLRRNPLFATAVIAILGLGIGVNTAVFSIVDAVLLRPLPYRDPEQLVKIGWTSSKRPVFSNEAKESLEWRRRADLFETVVPFHRDMSQLTGVGDPDQVITVRTSGALFPMLGVRAQMGRTLVEADDDSSNVVVLSDRTWRRRFRADRNVLGKVITISDEACTIVGVMPPEFQFPQADIEMWRPLRVRPGATNAIQMIARMRPGLALGRIQSAAAIVAKQWEREDPVAKGNLKLEVSEWTETAGRPYELTLLFVLAAVGLVLLIACANVGGLLLSRAVQRQREIAIRASLGAGVWKVMRQLLIESLTLAAFGSAAGILLAHFVLQFLSDQLTALPILIPHLQRVSLNGRVLAFNAVLCIVLAVLCSAAPVVMARKTDLQAVLRSGQGTSGSKRSARLFSLLIAFEAAFAFLLLVGSGLMIRSLVKLQEADHGFHADHVLTLRVPVGTQIEQKPKGKYETKPAQMAHYKEILDRLEQVPGLTAVAFVNNLPLSNANTTTLSEGRDGKTLLVMTRNVSPHYFLAMGIGIVKGRVFTDADGAQAPGVIILNEYMARQTFPDRDPIGQTMPGSTMPLTVVGVVRDAAQMSYDQPAQAEIYRPYQQMLFGAFLSTIVVRTAGDPLKVANAIRKEIWAVDPNQPIVKMATMEEIVSNSIWRPRFSAWIFSVLGGLALLLTSIGVYSIVAYTTSLRMREVGIRVALGATPGRVVGEILRGAMVPLAVGLVVSVGAALLLGQYLTTLLYEISAMDPVAFVAAGGVLLAIGVVASARPAWRAAVADPVRSLRND